MAWLWNKENDENEKEQIEVRSEMVRHLQLISRQTDNVMDIADQVLSLSERMSEIEAENQILRDKIDTLESKEA